MGVPTVSLAGGTGVSRVGLSILSNVGLTDWVARTPEQFVQIASDLAADQSRIAQLRGALRESLQRSPLMDAASFATAMETAIRRMWTEWCTRA